MPKIPDEELLEKAKDRYRRARDHNSKWKHRTRTAYDYYAGRQWDDDERERLEQTGRAAVVMNRIKPRVSAVVGMEIGNRQELRYSPREKQDQALVDLINQASEWTRDQSETEDHESAQFQDMVICGMGWSETLMSYEENLDGMAAVEQRDPLAYDWDPDSRQPNLADAKYFFYSQDVDEEDFERMGFPIEKAGRSALGVSELWELTDEPHDAENAHLYPNEVPMSGQDRDRARGKKTHRLVEYQYVTHETIWRVMGLDGVMFAVDPDEADEKLAQFEAETGQRVIFEEFSDKEPLRVGIEGTTVVLPYVEQKRRMVYRAYISGDNVLENEPAPCPYTFTHHCMTGWRDHTNGTWFGMVEGLIDPQDWSNKFFSQAIYIYTVNPKGGVMIKKKAVDNPNDFEDNYAAPDAVTWLRDDANLQTDILERRPGQYPSDLDKLTAFAIDSLPALDGLTPEMMGQVSRDQPGVLEKMRKQASMTVLAPLFDAKRRYHKRQGRTLMHYIARFFTPAQLRRIVGQPIPEELMDALRKQDVRNYDVVVDDAPTSPNQKEYTLNILMELIRQAPDIAPAVAPMLVKNSPLTMDVQQELLDAVSQYANPQNSPQFKALQQQYQKTKEERDQLKTRAEVESLKIAAKAATDKAKIEQDDDEHEDEIALERDQLRQEFALKMRELDDKFELALMEMRNELQIARERPQPSNGATNG